MTVTVHCYWSVVYMSSPSNDIDVVVDVVVARTASER